MKLKLIFLSLISAFGLSSCESPMPPVDPQVQAACADHIRKIMLLPLLLLFCFISSCAGSATLLPNGAMHLNGPLLGKAANYIATASDGKKKLTLVITNGDGTAPITAIKGINLARISSDTTKALDKGLTTRKSLDPIITVPTVDKATGTVLTPTTQFAPLPKGF